MNFFSYFPNALDFFAGIWYLFIHGGWVAFVIAIIYVLYKLYRFEIGGQFRSEQEWVFLSIRAPRVNQQSLLGVEQIYAQLHVLHAALTWAQKYMEGRIQLWYSFELVSLGGKISLIIRAPKRMRDTVEAAFYAQYPNCEITEVNDYMANITYDPDTSDFDLFGFEMTPVGDQLFPFRTYREFEHPSAEIPILDPMGPMFEALGALQPHEFMGMQIIAQPLGDPEWKPKADAKAKELLGEGEATKPFSIYNLIDEVVAMFNPITIIGMLLKPDEPVKPPETAETRKDYAKMSEVEKKRLDSLLRKSSKPGYSCKIRVLYMAPKDKFDGAKKAAVISGLRPLSDAQINGLKPAMGDTGTSADYRISPTLEAPYLNALMRSRKRFSFDGYKKRDLFIGLEQFILNIEELATLFHLPITEPEATTMAPVERVDSRKTQAPVNLPTE